MRRLIILLNLMLLTSLGLAAQQHYSANISIGGKAGMTMSQVMFSPSVEQGFIMGSMAGVQFRYIEEKHFGVIAELNFEQRGWKEKFDETDYSYERTLNYIQIPLLAHIYFGNKAKFFFNAGPEIGFLISENKSANFDYIDIKNNPADFPVKNRNTDQFTMDIKNKVDYGISAGLGMELKIGQKNSVALEGRFYYGLNNIFPSHKKDVFAASNEMSIMVSLGYLFRLK